MKIIMYYYDLFYSKEKEKKKLYLKEIVCTYIYPLLKTFGHQIDFISCYGTKSLFLCLFFQCFHARNPGSEVQSYQIDLKDQQFILYWWLRKIMVLRYFPGNLRNRKNFTLQWFSARNIRNFASAIYFFHGMNPKWTISHFCS